MPPTKNIKTSLSQVSQRENALFTVIFLDKYSSDLLVDYRFLFQEFENSGDIGICPWNENGSNFETMLPDIKRVIQGKREWRAIVVNTDSLYGYQSRPVPDAANPFDYSHVDRDKAPHKSAIALIRLCHVLGGYPAPVREFEDGFEFYDQNNELRQMRRSELEDEDIAYISEQFAPVKSIFMEKAIPEGIRKRHQALEKKFAFDGIRPSEILLVATRNQREVNVQNSVAEAWKNPTEMASSAFCERNKYPTNCRFLFSEISSTHSANYGRDLTKFWLSVLTLAQNKIPPASLQAYRLYKLSIDISCESLQALLNDHLDKLQSVQRFIHDELIKEADPKVRGNVQYYDEVEIAVVPEKDDEKNIVSTEEDEKAPEWILVMNERLGKFNNHAKDTRRAIDRAARRLRSKSEYYYKREDPVCMDEFHLGDLKADMAQRELEILSSRPKNHYDREKVNRILNEAKVQQTQHLADEEMPYKKAAAAIAVLLALFGYCPWLIESFEEVGFDNFLKVFGVTILVIGIMLCGGFIAMNQFRRSMKKKVYEITDKFKEVQKDMDDTVNSYSKYFSSIGTFMSAQSALQRVSLSDETKVFHDQLSVHNRAINSLVETDKRWMNNFELDRIETPIQHTESFFNSEIPPHENSMYYYPISDNSVDIPLNTAGDRIHTPYTFISGMHIQREAIFDDVGAK